MELLFTTNYYKKIVLKECNLTDPAMKAVVQTYLDYYILITSELLQGGPKDPVGYVTASGVYIYINNTWKTISAQTLKFGPRTEENDIIVGYMELKSGKLRFKTRSPLHHIETQSIRDSRSLTKGAVCSTRPRKTQEVAAQKLNIPYANESNIILCQKIQKKLLDLELRARRKKNGMVDGERWFYLFNEALPTITVQNKT